METFVILRRQGWKWVRTYVLSEDDGTMGTVCIFQANEDALRQNAAVPDLRVSEILRVGGTFVENLIQRRFRRPDHQ